MKGRAVIYARSTSRFGIVKQFFHTWLYAKRHNVKIVNTYLDYNAGNGKAGKRPEFGHLLSDLRTGGFKFIVVTDAKVISEDWKEVDYICHLVKKFNVGFEVISLMKCSDSTPFRIQE